jgi:hypothetical protein
MTAASGTFAATRFNLGSYDGQTVAWIAGDATMLAALDEAMLVVDDLDGTTIATGTIDVVIDQVDGEPYLLRDPLSTVPTADTSSGSPAVVVVAEDTGDSSTAKLLAWQTPTGGTAPGFTDWPYDPTNGIAKATANPSSNSLPDQTGHAGEYLTTDGTTASWATVSGGSTRQVAIFVGFGSVPREFLVGLSMLVVEGDDLGVWTITASGTCTAGDALGFGEVIASQALQGLIANTSSSEGEVVDGVKVQATEGYVDTLNAATAANAATASATNAAAIDTETAIRSVYAGLVAQAERTAPPTRWLECGYGTEPIDELRGHWFTPTTLASPTTSWRTRAWVRTLAVLPEGAECYQETYSECLDAEGVPGAGGSLDRNEQALRSIDGEIGVYQEWTEPGGTAEVAAIFGNGVPPATWVDMDSVIDFPSGVVKARVRDDVNWDEVDGDGDKWRVVETYSLGRATTLEASDGLEAWLGRGPGRFDLARVRVWTDGVLRVDPDIAGADIGDTVVDDPVLGDDWTARVNAVVGGSTDADAVTAVLADIAAATDVADLKTALTTYFTTLA